MAFLPKKGTDREYGMFGLQKDINSLFNRFFENRDIPSFFNGRAFSPALDMVETEDEVQVKADIPGVDPKEMDISITGDTLTIKGEKKQEREEEDGNFHIVERSNGSFSRTVSLPPYADTTEVSADFAKGVLTVRLKKRAEGSGKTIRVDVK